jgi:small-conductance mechanosensitive channel
MDLKSINFESIITNPTVIKIFFFLLTIFITYFVGKIIRKTFLKKIEKYSRKMHIDATHFSLLKHLISALIYIIGFAIALNFLTPLKSLAISMFASAGVLALVVGFAAQQAFSNIISGVFIAIFKPFRVGDMIRWSDKAGVVEDITLRHTIIRNVENKRYIVPNTKIANETIENYNLKENKTCRLVEIGISYESEINHAISIIQDEVQKHIDFMDNRTKKEIKNKIDPVSVRVINLGESSVKLRAYAWASDPSAAFRMGCDLNKSIKERFDRERIEIPYPHVTLLRKKP